MRPGPAAGVLVALAVLCWGLRPPAAGRLTVVRPVPAADPPGGPRQVAWAQLTAVAAAAGLGYVLAGFAGTVAGAAAAAVLARRLPDAPTRRERDRRARLRADLPWAAELLAACLVAGASSADAAEAVAAAVGGPVGEALHRAVALQRLGGDPPSCWLGLATDPELAAVGRALARAAESGTPAAPVVAAEAALARAESRLAAQAALARVGVLATAPLGLCFLPAFLLLGIVPVVVGLGADVLA